MENGKDGALCSAPVAEARKETFEQIRDHFLSGQSESRATFSSCANAKDLPFWYLVELDGVWSLPPFYVMAESGDTQALRITQVTSIGVDPRIRPGMLIGLSSQSIAKAAC